MTPAGCLGPFRRPPSLARSEAVALAGELEDDAVVNEPIDDYACGHWVGEHLGPVGKRQVRCQSDACAFIALRDNLIKQIGCLTRKTALSGRLRCS
jgi:hypothetical protein